MKQKKIGVISLGILLVLIGTAALYSQIVGFSFLEVVARWWPAVLIILGLEILFFNIFVNKEEYKIKLDAASIIIIILITTVLGVTAGVNNIVKNNFGALRKVGTMLPWDNINFPGTTQFKKNASVDAAKSSKLTIDNSLGEIKLEKASGSKLEISANITVNNNDGDYANSLADQILKIEEGATIKVSAEENFDKNKIGSIKVNYVIKVPSNLEVEASNKFGNITVSNLDKNLKVDNTNGEIKINGIGGNLDINNKFGSTSIENVKGNVNFESTNGDIKIKEIGGALVVRNKFGQIRATNVTGPLDVQSANGDVSIECSKILDTSMKVECTFGNVELTLPEKQTGSYKLSTKFGNIKGGSQISVSKTDNGINEKAEGSFQEGKASFSVNCTNGNITINK